MIVGVALWVYLLAIRRDAVADAIANRKRRSPWASLLTFVLGFGLLVLFVRWLSVDEGLRRRLAARIGQSQAAREPDARRLELATSRSSRPDRCSSSSRSSRSPSWRGTCPTAPAGGGSSRLSEPLLPALADVLDETLDDLRAESDPRRAVIAAYARMERALARVRPSAQPVGGAGRVPARASSPTSRSAGRATSRLTALFSWAKFSGHDVAPEMKEEAIEALEAVRAELRAAEILAEHRRLEAQRELRERAGS